MSWSRTLRIRQALRAQIEAGEDIGLLFSDIRGFSTYTKQKGDRAAYRLTRLHDGILRKRIDEYGIVVKSLGDGIMAAFEEPLGAIEAAVAIQRAILERNREEPAEPIDVGIGVSCGLPVMSDLDFIGHSVNLAQRLSALAKGGQILVSERVREAAPLPEGLEYLFLGERILYGIGSERIFEVTWLKEVARVSDGGDRLTVVLTEDGTIVAEFAKGRGLQEAVEELRRVRPEEEGLIRALLLRGISAVAGRLLRSSLIGEGIPREQPLDRVELRYRRGRLRLRTPDGALILSGVPKDEAERFLRAAKERRKRGGFEEGPRLS